MPKWLYALWLKRKKKNNHHFYINVESALQKSADFFADSEIFAYLCGLRMKFAPIGVIGI